MLEEQERFVFDVRGYHTDTKAHLPGAVGMPLKNASILPACFQMTAVRVLCTFVTKALRRYREHCVWVISTCAVLTAGRREGKKLDTKSMASEASLSFRLASKKGVAHP
jgi:hypothetical protein